MAVDRAAIMRSAMADLKSKMPDDTIGLYNEIGADLDVETISTGSIAVDGILGGGFAIGRLNCLVGHTSSGKTTLALTAVANMQKEKSDANIVFIDAEQALDPGYAMDLGVDMDKVWIHQPMNGENAIAVALQAINSGVCDLIVIDSVAALLPKELLEADLGAEARPGVFAKFISRATGQLFGAANKNKTTVILINQWKPQTKMSTFQAGAGTAGTSWYMPGGQQLPFFLTQLIEIKKSGSLTEGGKVVTNKITATVKKNKIAPPYRTADFFITFGVGVDKIHELIGLGFQYGVLKGAGFINSEQVPEIAKINGRPKLRSFLQENPDIADKLGEAVKIEVKDFLSKNKGNAQLTVDATEDQGLEPADDPEPNEEELV